RCAPGERGHARPAGPREAPNSARGGSGPPGHHRKAPTKPMTDTFVLDAVRTPFGKYGGALSGVRPDDLAAHAVRSLLDRSPGLDPARIDDILFGDANAAGEDNRNVARMASLLAGLPTSVPGTTLNRLCGSGLEAVIAA